MRTYELRYRCESGTTARGFRARPADHPPPARRRGTLPDPAGALGQETPHWGGL